MFNIGDRMKTEIEARFLECNEEKIIEKLNNCGAKFVGDWLQIRYCYDFNPVNPNSWIRLRTNGKETTLTIKEIQDKSISGTKSGKLRFQILWLQTKYSIKWGIRQEANKKTGELDIC